MTNLSQLKGQTIPSRRYCPHMPKIPTPASRPIRAISANASMPRPADVSQCQILRSQHLGGSSRQVIGIRRSKGLGTTGMPMPRTILSTRVIRTGMLRSGIYSSRSRCAIKLTKTMHPALIAWPRSRVTSASWRISSAMTCH